MLCGVGLLLQIAVSVNALVLAALSMAGALNAPLLLALTFVNGVGLAMRWPVFAALIPEIVPRHQLPSALALNGVAMNASSRRCLQAWVCLRPAFDFKCS